MLTCALPNWSVLTTTEMSKYSLISTEAIPHTKVNLNIRLTKVFYERGPLIGSKIDLEVIFANRIA